jgi:hypothetical protein
MEIKTKRKLEVRETTPEVSGLRDSQTAKINLFSGAQKSIRIFLQPAGGFGYGI